jgi:hypothetical protein
MWRACARANSQGQRLGRPEKAIPEATLAPVRGLYVVKRRSASASRRPRRIAGSGASALSQFDRVAAGVQAGDCLMRLGDRLPTRIVFGVSDEWLAWLVGATIILAILLGAWKLLVVLRRTS